MTEQVSLPPEDIIMQNRDIVDARQSLVEVISVTLVERLFRTGINSICVVILRLEPTGSLYTQGGKPQNKTIAMITRARSQSRVTPPPPSEISHAGDGSKSSINKKLCHIFLCDALGVPSGGAGLFTHKHLLTQQEDRADLAATPPSARR